MSISAVVSTAGQLAETRRLFNAVVAALPGERLPASICVAGAEPGDGKSVTAAALALVAARQIDKPVLLVDADWFHPVQHQLFGCPEADFAVGVWQQNGDINGHVLPLSAGKGQLFLLPAPRDRVANPTGILESLLREIRAVFAFTIFDTAAINSVNRQMLDPVNLMGEVDGTVLTVMINVTPRSAVRQAQKQIEAGGGRLLGIIVNNYRNPLAEVVGRDVKARGW